MATEGVGTAFYSATAGIEPVIDLRIEKTIVSYRKIELGGLGNLIWSGFVRSVLPGTQFPAPNTYRNREYIGQRSYTRTAAWRPGSSAALPEIATAVNTTPREGLVHWHPHRQSEFSATYFLERIAVSHAGLPQKFSTSSRW